MCASCDLDPVSIICCVFKLLLEALRGCFLGSAGCPGVRALKTGEGRAHRVSSGIALLSGIGKRMMFFFAVHHAHIVRRRGKPGRVGDSKPCAN